MTKEVLVSLCGLQFDQHQEEPEKVEMLLGGEYFNKNGKHYVIYEEMTEGFDTPTKNRLKFQDGCLELTRTGLVNVHMVFEEKKKNMTSYNTPFGQIIIGIDAKKIAITETDNQIDVSVDYALDINYEYLSDCHIQIKIKSKEL